MRFLVRSCVMGRGADTFSISIAMALASKMPTQIGITVSEPTSFSTTMGMLVAGSIISPRIRTSISMDSLSRSRTYLLDGLADQTVWMRPSDSHLHIIAWGRRNLLDTSKVHWNVLAA